MWVADGSLTESATLGNVIRHTTKVGTEEEAEDEDEEDEEEVEVEEVVEEEK